MTTDGGLTWTQQSLATRYSIRNFSRVPGVNGGMVVSAYDAGGGVSTTVLYTPDFFNTLSVVQTGILSTGESDFYNNRSGWLAGDGNYTSSIYKFTSNLPVGIQETTGEIPQIMVYPNPSSAEAIIQVPANFIQKDLILRICDIRGKIIENSVVTAASNYIQLNAEKYSDGIYIIQMTGDDGVSAVCRWTVCHK
jgi:hypothetical protein